MSKKGLQLLLNEENENMVVFRVRRSARVIYRNTFQRLEIPGIPQWNPEHPAANSQPIDIPGARFGDHVDVEAVLAAPPVGSPHCCHCSHLVVMERSLQAMLPATPPVGPQYQYQLRRTKSASF